MRGNKFENSYIHILESETLSRESRVTGSAQLELFTGDDWFGFFSFSKLFMNFYQFPI